MKKSNILVNLSNEFSQIDMSDTDKDAAISDAHWVATSPHEWVWTTEQQANMARYALWATQRIDAICQIANGEPLVHADQTIK